MTEKRHVTPSRIIPAGIPLPAGANPPPPRPPQPPAPPTDPPPLPDWWHRPPVAPAPVVPAPPPPPPEVYVHVDVHLPAPIELEPEPGPRWYRRFRLGYTVACATASLPLTGPWAAALTACRDHAGLTGAWVLALVPLAITAFADNVYRIAAAGAHPDLWPPKIRAAIARVLLCAAVIAPALTLPIATLVTTLTGVRS